MTASRAFGRAPQAIRDVEMVPGFHRLAEGSALYRAGGTVVLATASVENKVPEFMEGQGKGWITAEYQMHPRSNPKRRENRDGRERPLGGRTREIQRLIGRSLRAAVDFERLGERTIHIDCDVLEADGGTRTASISAGFVALALAIARLEQTGSIKRGVIREQVAAVSCGLVNGEQLLDLCYAEDSTARVDLNLVATRAGNVIEVQATAEGEPVARREMDELVDLAFIGIAELTRVQEQVLARAGVDLARLLAPRKG